MELQRRSKITEPPARARADPRAEVRIDRLRQEAAQMPGSHCHLEGPANHLIQHFQYPPRPPPRAAAEAFINKQHKLSLGVPVSKILN